MLTYRFATSNDRANMIDLIDLVFSQVRVPHDFEKLLPKVYGEHVNMSEIHAIAMDGDQVRGCLGSYPLTQTVQSETLHIGYLGSMAVHHRERGSGAMKVLMQMQIDHAKETGLDLMLLGGQRQRYEYFGFYPCGSSYTYNIGRSTVRHGLRNVEGTLAFAPMIDAAYAQKLYDRQSVRGARTVETFLDCAKSYNHLPWMIFNGETPAGYLIASETGDHITELIMEDDALILNALKSWWAAKGLTKLDVSVPAYQVALNRALASFAENYSLGKEGMMRILNPERTIRAYMKLKQSLTPLQDGKLNLQMGDFDTLAIQVVNGEVSISPTDEEPDLRLTMEEATHLLFSFNRFSAPAVSAPEGWFPLPFSVASADTF